MTHVLHAREGMGVNGLLLVAIGSLGVSLRELPVRIGEALARLMTMTVTVKDADPAFAWVKEWLREQPFQRRLRRVDLDTSVRANEMSMMPAPGAHWFWYQGRPFRVHYERAEAAASTGRSLRRTESMTFTTVGRHRPVLERFIAEIEASHRRTMLGLSRLHVYDDFWCEVRAYAPRSLEAVLLRAGEKERLLEDLRRFRAARERYRSLGVPYHRGYLFFGPPGTGKTSLVSALAAAFGMSLYAMNLSEMDDRSLKAAMSEVPENSVVLFEDIDCMKLQRRALGDSAARPAAPAAGDAKSRVTLSGLLNVLDGFHAPENVVFVMTTNDAEALDPALLRPGRVDYKLYLGAASREQRVCLYRRFFPAATTEEAEAFAARHQRCTMAEFQGELLRLSEASSSAAGGGPASAQEEGTAALLLR